MRDTNQIENLAVAHIVELFSSCKRICPWLKMGDREPLWDGALFLYDSDDHNNSTLKGRVQCQIKGLCLSSADDTESFYVTKEDLANYLRDGGVLFFVVHVDDLSKSSYWSKLTPVELRQLLKDIEGSNQKGKAILLSRMPNNLNECESETFEFYRHCQLQKAPPISMEHLAHTGSRFHVEGVARNGMPPIVALTKGFHYLYKCDEDGNVQNVIGDSQFSFQISKEIDSSYIIGEKEFKVPVQMVVKNGITHLNVGRFLHIESNPPDGYRINFSANDISGVRERSLALQALLAMDEGEYMMVPSNNMSFSCTEVHLSQEKKDEIKYELGNLLKVVSLCDHLHIVEDLSLTALSKKDLAELNTLYQAIIENKPVHPDVSDENVFTMNVTIGNVVILVWLIKDEDGYHVKDFFGNYGYEVAVSESDSDEMHRVSRFAVLDAKGFLRYSNIDWQLIPSDYKNLEVNIPEVAHQINQDVINLLTAYDESKRREILDAALRLSEWLVMVCKETEEFIIYRVNNLQTIKRSRCLTDIEKHEVARYADDKDATLELKYCCDLLLDDQIRATMHLSAMADDMQALYELLPISFFRKK